MVNWNIVERRVAVALLEVLMRGSLVVGGSDGANGPATSIGAELPFLSGTDQERPAEDGFEG